MASWRLLTGRSWRDNAVSIPVEMPGIARGWRQPGLILREYLNLTFNADLRKVSTQLELSLQSRLHR
jgi:hypothetical protein